MQKEFIKNKLLNKENGAYSIIVSNYYDKIKELRPKNFLDWLALELDISAEKINLNNLYAAIKRHKNRFDQKGRIEPAGNDLIQNPKKSNFPFSREIIKENTSSPKIKLL